MAMAVEPCSSSSSFIFFPQHRKIHLRHIIYFPFFPFSRSHLCRRFSSYAARGGSSNDRKRGRIKWDSNAETIRAKDFTLNTQNDDDEEEEEYDDEEMASSGILKEVIDSIWIFKVFKSYGWTSPVILLSLFFATGPKAFLMALSVPLGQSAITLAYEKLLGRSESKKKSRAKVRRKTKKTSSPPTVENVKMKEEVGEGRKSREGRKDYQSWVVTDGMGSVNDEDASRFGGWDELDGDGMGSMRMSSTVVSGSTSKTTTKEKSKLNMKHSTSDAPLLLRLLISVFPFLSELFW